MERFFSVFPIIFLWLILAISICMCLRRCGRNTPEMQQLTPKQKKRILQHREEERIKLNSTVKYFNPNKGEWE